MSGTKRAEVCLISALGWWPKQAASSAKHPSCCPSTIQGSSWSFCWLTCNEQIIVLPSRIRRIKFLIRCYVMIYFPGNCGQPGSLLSLDPDRTIYIGLQFSELHQLLHIGSKSQILDKRLIIACTIFVCEKIPLV